MKVHSDCMGTVKTKVESGWAAGLKWKFSQKLSIHKSSPTPNSKPMLLYLPLKIYILTYTGGALVRSHDKVLALASVKRRECRQWLQSLGNDGTQRLTMGHPLSAKYS